MLTAALITFREGLEAALIVGIVLGYLGKTGHRTESRYAWLGVLLASLLSVGIALGMLLVGASLKEPYEQMFEGGTMLLAVAILTWMIFWMRYQSRFLKQELEQKVHTVLSGGAMWGLLGLTFFSVLREGIETALFLSASAFAQDGSETLIGALLGLALAIAFGYALYAMSVRLNIRVFFDVTSVLLLIFAAGLFAHGIHEFQEINWLPILTVPVWDTGALLSNGSLLGSILRSLVGYNDHPSGLEVVGYVFYWAVILLGIRWWTQRLTTRTTVERV
ncbi:MAG: FTR1 family protein [Chloroflexi bacterium]|nr:FTR1 family protein [Chloroflexota bacterium]